MFEISPPACVSTAHFVVVHTDYLLVTLLEGLTCFSQETKQPDMQTDKEEDEDASPEEYVAHSDFSGSGSDQVRDPHRHEASQSRGIINTNRVDFISQLSFTSGDKLLVHTKPSSDWWWAELQGVTGYVPASYLHPDGAEEEDSSLQDPWQDDEYFGSYGTLVRDFT